ncbi:MAG: 3-hydroxyacyl-CoA dehydrogenase family protein [Azospirillaceae bacterium]
MSDSSASLPAFDPARPVAMIGMGTMGTKVAWACARAGLETRCYDIAGEDALTAARARALGWSEGEEQERVAAHLHVTADLDNALDGVQLAFENVYELIDLKRRTHADLGGRLPTACYLGSNASSLPATPIAEASGRPDRFFCLNFSDPRTGRLVELMGADRMAPETAVFAQAWARHIGMVPVHCRKEQMGYVFNRIWRVIKKEVLRQIAEGYADAESIDRAWRLAFGTDFGPCSLMDEIGLGSVLKIEHAYADESGDPSDRPPTFLEAWVAEGRLGIASGEGFYRYPDPTFAREGWLDGEGTAAATKGTSTI